MNPDVMKRMGVMISHFKYSLMLRHFFQIFIINDKIMNEQKGVVFFSMNESVTCGLNLKFVGKIVAGLILSLGVISLPSKAQPGYLGKKITLNYSLELTPVPSFVTRKVDERESIMSFANSGYSSGIFNEEEKFMNMVFGHYLQGSYTISRKSSLVANVGYRMRTIYLTKLFYQMPDLSPTLQVSHIQYPLDAHEWVMDVSYRSFYRDFIAPVGIFWQVGFGSSTMAYQTKDDILVLGEDYGSYNLPIEVTPRKYTAMRLGVGLGLVKPLSDILFLTASTDVYIPLTSGGNFDSYTTRPGRQKEQYLRDNLIMNSRVYNWMAIKIGVGTFI